MGLSIWLVPDAPTAEFIRTRMPRAPSAPSSLAPQSFPPFYPHITLATVPASISDLPRLRAALPALSRIPISFRALEAGSTFTRSVYLSVHSSLGLCALEAHIRTALQCPQPPPSFPHMSLAYIDDSDAEERARTVDALFNTKVITKTMGGVAFERWKDAYLLTGFEGAAIWIVKTEGPVADWSVLDEISIQP